MIKVALIGCGRIGKKHAQLLSSQIEGAKLVAVCDISLNKTLEFQKEYDVYGRGFDCSIHDNQIQLMIEETSPDLITLATPSGLHYEHLQSLGKYKIPILVEKPLVLDLGEVNDLQFVMDKRNYFNGWLCEVKQNRYNIAVQHLRNNIHRLGKIRFASVRVLWSRQPEYYQDWHGQWSMAGGVLANQAIHHIDLLWWLIGDVKRVSAFAIYDDYTEVETGLVATLEFENGTIGTVEVTTLCNKDLEGSLTVIGDNGTVELGGFAVNQIQTWQFKDELPSDNAIFASGIETPPNVYGYGHLKLYEDVIKSLENNTEPPIPLWQARKSLEIVHAIYESVEAGEIVELTGNYPHSRLGR